MNAEALIAQLHSLDVRLKADGDKLRLSAPKGVLTAAESRPGDESAKSPNGARSALLSAAHVRLDRAVGSSTRQIAGRNL